MNDGPVHVKSHSARPAVHNSQQPVKRGGRGRLIGLIAGVIVVLAIFAAVGWLLVRTSVSSQIEGGKYQAVFFTNGQVYFGKLKSLNGGYFKLTDIFYLQAKNSDGSNPQKTGKDDEPDLQLTPLGGEIHGPENEMIMNKDQILFFENLKSDSKVSSAIEKYNSDKK